MARGHQAARQGVFTNAFASRRLAPSINTKRRRNAVSGLRRLGPSALREFDFFRGLGSGAAKRARLILAKAFASTVSRVHSRRPGRQRPTRTSPAPNTCFLTGPVTWETLTYPGPATEAVRLLA